MNINVDVKQNENDIQVNIAGEIDVYSARCLERSSFLWQNKART